MRRVLHFSCAVACASLLSTGAAARAADPPSDPFAGLIDALLNGGAQPAPQPGPEPAPEPSPPPSGDRAPVGAPDPPGRVPPAEAARRPSDTRLSNEWTVSRWAHSERRAAVYSSASSHSRRIARLRSDTEDGLAEVYLALRSHVTASGVEWVQVRLPERRRRSGWVKRDDLGPLHRVTTALVIDRRHLRASLYRRGKRIFRAPVGVGKSSTPTPAGRFWIREKLSSFRSPVYGPLAFGTSAYARISDWPGGGVVGIHGTNQPELVPGRPSHGCVRLENRHIRRLGKLMPIGTPVRIR